MKDPKKLAFVLSVLQSLPADNETESFWREVAKVAGNAVSKDKSQVVGDWFSAITVDDIHRIKQYLTLRDKVLKLNAKKFYEAVQDKELKKQLVADFREMKIALMDNDILEYGRRVGVQLECSFNYVVIKVDAWRTIGADPVKYRSSRLSFFDNQGQNRTLHSITLPAKHEFCRQYYDFQTNRISYDFNAFHDIVFVRNQASHRSQLSSTDKIRLETLNQANEKSVARFSHVFVKIIENLEDLYK